jgi:phasin family protein
MFPIQDQISVATKASLEAQFALFNSLTNKTLESVEKLVKLNLTAAKASMEESGAATRQILAAKDPQEFLSLVTAQTKPTFEKAMAYGGHLANIASSTQAEFTKATEQQIATVSSKLSELVESAAKNAPAGSENFVAILQSAIGNANAGYEQFSRTAKQAADAVEANLNSTLSQFSAPAEKAGQKIIVES